MKPSLFLLVALGMVTCPAAAFDFTLNGCMPALSDSAKVSLVNTDRGEDPIRMGSAQFKDGKFSITGDVPYPSMCQIIVTEYLPEKGQPSRVLTANLMVAPGDNLIESDATVAEMGNSLRTDTLVRVSGHVAHDEYRQYMAEIGQYENKAKLAGYQGASKYFSSNGNTDTVAKYDAITRHAEAELQAAKLYYVAQRPSQHVSAWIANEAYKKPFTLDGDTYTLLHRTVTACPDTARAARNDQMYRFAMQYALGMQCPDFEASTPELEAVNISKYITPGRFMLLDFWASWCGPCRAAIPKVKAMQERYTDLLDICSVSIDEDEDGWRAAMEKENMSWTQLWLQGDQVKNTAQAFYITSIPRLILLDPNGRIICSTNKPALIEETLAKMAPVADGRSFIINARIPGLPGGSTVRLDNIEGGKRDRIAELTTDGDTFALTGNVARPTLCWIRIENKETQLSSAMQLMLENCAYELTAELADSLPPSFSSDDSSVRLSRCVSITGGQAQREYSIYELAMYPTRLAEKQAHSALWWSKNELSKEEHDALEKNHQAIALTNKAAQDKFIKENPTYSISMYLTCQNLRQPYAYSATELDEILDRSKGAWDTQRYEQLQTAATEARTRLKEQTYTDFAILDTQMTESQISSHFANDQYQLIDFWASWCGPCRAAIPHVRNLHNQYAGKLNVMAVSFDSDEAAWRKAMDQEKMEWRQLWAPDEKMDAIRKIYGIDGIPCLMLLDPSGHILYTGFDPAQLDNILSNLVL